MRAFSKITLPFGEKIHSGKVRDTFRINKNRILITTDRQSAFDRILASIPYKGQVLNQTAAFWFDFTKDIVPNHFIAMPDPNVIIAKDATVFSIEFVVRAYMTGTTDTSIWVNYQNGVRNFCGNKLSNGLQKNQKLENIIITPTTKPEIGHDENVSREEIIERSYMSAEDFDKTASYAIALFKRGQEHCAKNGLILVDTKYEFGKDSEGNIILIDEIHTPDSSRFWDMESYEDSIAKKEDPKSFDKDVLRRWYAKNSNPYEDRILPEAPQELIEKMTEAYISAYEKITGKKFEAIETDDINTRIAKNLQTYFQM